MRQKKWTDCPSCGSKGTMVEKHGLARTLQVAGGYSPVEVSGLDGQFCKVCGDGFLSNQSQRKLTKAIAEHMAQEDTRRIVASEIADIPEAVEALGVSRQAVYNMMEEGRLRYVFVGKERRPVRKDLARVKAQAARFAKTRSRGTATAPSFTMTARSR